MSFFVYLEKGTQIYLYPNVCRWWRFDNFKGDQPFRFLRKYLNKLANRGCSSADGCGLVKSGKETVQDLLVSPTLISAVQVNGEIRRRQTIERVLYQREQSLSGRFSSHETEKEIRLRLLPRDWIVFNRGHVEPNNPYTMLSMFCRLCFSSTERAPRK